MLCTKAWLHPYPLSIELKHSSIVNAISTRRQTIRTNENYAYINQLIECIQTGGAWECERSYQSEQVAKMGSKRGLIRCRKSPTRSCNCLLSLYSLISVVFSSFTHTYNTSIRRHFNLLHKSCLLSIQRNRLCQSLSLLVLCISLVASFDGMGMCQFWY